MSYYEEEYNQQDWCYDNGYIHEDDVPDTGHVKDMLAGIIKALYKTGDIASLEDCLEELTIQFEMKIPKEKPVLERSASVRETRILGPWLNYNHGYNECLRRTATS